MSGERWPAVALPRQEWRLRRTGLAVEALHGDLDGSPLGIEAERLIATARKAG